VREARVALVVAVAENGIIGRAGKLPWRLPADLRHFRELTLGKPMIMGRKTYASIGGPLDGRDTIVLSARGDSYPRGVRVAASFPEALATARELATARGADEIIIAGGAEVYRAALPMAERIYLTLVHARPEGDTVLGPFAADAWREVARRPMPAGRSDEFGAEFIVLERRSPLPPPPDRRVA
jgi:dihydrofolate reductase